jgi:hypothetical protein
MNESFNCAPIQPGWGEVPVSSKCSHVIRHRTHTPSLNPLSLPMGRKVQYADTYNARLSSPRFSTWTVRARDGKGQKRKDGFPVRRLAESRRTISYKVRVRTTHVRVRKVGDNLISEGEGSEPRVNREARLILGPWAVFRMKGNCFPKHNGCSGRAALPQILQDDQKFSETSVCLRFTVSLHGSEWDQLFFPVYKSVGISSRGGAELSCYGVFSQSAYCCALALVCHYDLSFRCTASGNIVQKFFLLFLRSTRSFVDLVRVILTYHSIADGCFGPYSRFLAWLQKLSRYLNASVPERLQL